MIDMMYHVGFLLLPVVMGQHRRTAGGTPWEDKLNKVLKEHRRARRSLQGIADEVVFPPANTTSVRLPGEFEPVSSVTIAFADWVGEVYGIAETLVSNTNVDVYILDAPALYQLDFFSPQVKYVPFDVNSVWTRDYAQVGVLLQDAPDAGETMAIVDMGYFRPDDDTIPCAMASIYQDWSCYGMDLELDGGNIMSDGYGNLFMTTRTYVWNEDLTTEEVDEKLRQYFGVTKIHALDYAKDEHGEPYDGTGHIDSKYHGHHLHNFLPCTSHRSFSFTK